MTSPFQEQMQALLAARLSATTEAEKQQAEEAMTALIRSVQEARRRQPARDWQRQAAGERDG